MDMVVEGEDREQIMIEAVKTADSDVKFDDETPEVTSQKLFTHLYGAASILHGYVAKEITDRI